MSKQRGSTVASKLAAMASGPQGTGEGISMNQLVAEFGKQRASLNEDFLDLMRPLQSSVNALTETVSGFNQRLKATETTVADNFEALIKAEKTIRHLEEQNETLTDRLDDLENRSRRANLRILNVPENSETGQSAVRFVSDMLMKVMPGAFDNPPELERAHRALGPRPVAGKPPRPFVVCFHKYQEKERALQWARTHEVKLNGFTLRIYPDLSSALVKKRAAFKAVKQKLYEKNVKFSLLYPTRLRVEFGKETFFFTSPGEASDFYDLKIASSQPAAGGRDDQNIQI